MNDKELHNPTPDEIELRDQGAHRRLAPIPRGLQLWGMVMVCVILIGLMFALILIPYPYSEGESILGHILGIYGK